MIDIHAHILPGVDDGSPSMEDSIEMARLALQSGVRAMIATPHCDLPGVHCVAARDIPLRVDLLTHALREAGLPLRIYPGMEIFGTPQTAERLKSSALCTLASSRYPLIEFPFADYGPEATDILHSVLRLGLRPIVAHPERYAYTQTQPQLLSVWVSMGCLLQINRGSLLGRFGERAETLAHRMLCVIRRQRRPLPHRADALAARCGGLFAAGVPDRAGMEAARPKSALCTARH